MQFLHNELIIGSRYSAQLAYFIYFFFFRDKCKMEYKRVITLPINREFYTTINKLLYNFLYYLLLLELLSIYIEDGK